MAGGAVAPSVAGANHQGVHEHMPKYKTEAHQTIEQMFNDFLRQATSGNPLRKIPDEVRPAYYAAATPCST
jgi:hypothetical protein